AVEGFREVRRNALSQRVGDRKQQLVAVARLTLALISPRSIYSFLHPLEPDAPHTLLQGDLPLVEREELVDLFHMSLLGCSLRARVRTQERTRHDGAP